MTTTVVIAIALFWLLSVIVALALARASAQGDTQLGYKDSDPYDERIRTARVERGLKLAAVQPIDTCGRPRLGIDVDHQRAPARPESPGA